MTEEQKPSQENKPKTHPLWFWIATGIAIGAGIGTVLDNIAVGVALGAAIGAAQNQKNK